MSPDPRWGLGMRLGGVKPEGILLECSVSYLELRRLKLKYTWQLTPNGRLPTGSTKFNHNGGGVASGKGHE